MSKSQGQRGDPLVVMEKYGSDAFLLHLAALAQGRDIRISEDRIEGYRNFANKIWNARAGPLEPGRLRPALAKKTPPALADLWIESRLGRLWRKRAPHSKLSIQRRGVGVYQFLWHEFCGLVSRDGQALPLSPGKPGPACAHPDDARRRAREDLAAAAPVHALHHEEIWQRLPHKGRIDHAGTVSARGRRKDRNPGRRATDDRGHGTL